MDPLEPLVHVVFLAIQVALDQLVLVEFPELLALLEPLVPPVYKEIPGARPEPQARKVL
jgi:hypothetical protein